MKTTVCVAICVGALAAMLSASGFAAAARIPYALGRPPGAVSVVSERFRLPTAQDGALVWRGVYVTSTPVADVWRWYAAHYHATPETGIDPAGQCLSLKSRDTLLKTDMHIALCYTARSTRVAVTRTFYVLP